MASATPPPCRCYTLPLAMVIREDGALTLIYYAITHYFHYAEVYAIKEMRETMSAIYIVTPHYGLRDALYDDKSMRHYLLLFYYISQHCWRYGCRRHAYIY